jgi:hypothetical protein
MVDSKAGIVAVWSCIVAPLIVPTPALYQFGFYRHCLFEIEKVQDILAVEVLELGPSPSANARVYGPEEVIAGQATRPHRCANVCIWP